MNSGPSATVPVSTRTGSAPWSTKALMAMEPEAGMATVFVITSTPDTAVKMASRPGVLARDRLSARAVAVGLRRHAEALEGGSHAREQLLVAVRGDVEDASPCRDPPHLVALGHPSAAIALRFESVTPHGGLAATLVGDEGELTATIRHQYPAVRL